MKTIRNDKRQPVTVPRDCAMDVISFNLLERTDHLASIVDISKNGVGVESDSPVAPGFVWFKNRIWGQQSGVLLWNEQRGARYRSGIRFAPLPPDAERFFNDQLSESRSREPLKDPEKIIEALFRSASQDAVHKKETR